MPGVLSLTSMENHGLIVSIPRARPEGPVPTIRDVRRRRRTTSTGSSVTTPSTMRYERNWKARPVRVRGGHQDVVRAGLVRVRDVGAGGVRLGRGVRVVDDHRLLVAVVHLAVELEQVAGVELVERGRAGRVQHRDEALGAAGARRARDDTARLVGVVGAGVRHDLVVQGLGDGQHAGKDKQRAVPYRGAVRRRPCRTPGAAAWSAEPGAARRSGARGERCPRGCAGLAGPGSRRPGAAAHSGTHVQRDPGVRVDADQHR